MMYEFSHRGTESDVFLCVFVYSYSSVIYECIINTFLLFCNTDAHKKYVKLTGLYNV